MPAIKRLQSPAWPDPAGFEHGGWVLNLSALPVAEGLTIISTPKLNYTKAE
jgi:hypothetical protein